MYFKVGDYYVSLDMFKTPFVFHKFALGILSYVRDNVCKRFFRQFIFEISMVAVDTTGGTCGSNGGMSVFVEVPQKVRVFVLQFGREFGFKILL